ncbi:MAG: Cell wall-associated hydrolase [Stygiobacter sp.]|nr:MAG: Cell wall-associated hydrolase [Stygiobacter sp.]KAF0214457.1 MAG: Cell wall-associated [Ignavibacteria bacterium]
MIKRALFFLIAVLCISLTAQETKMNSVTQIIHEVKNQFAPDKRVAIFHINASDTSDIITLSGETNLLEAKEKLISGIKSLGVEFKDEIRLLPAAELGERIYGLVNLSVANVRTKPDHAEEMTTQALLGTPVKIFKKESGYFLVQTPDEYISWVENDGVTPVSKQELDEWKNSERVIYLKEFGFSYSKPDVTSIRVSDLVAGNILVKLGEENNFLKVKYPDGRIAFVEKDNCQKLTEWLEKENPTNADIISSAEKFMGIPYLWGGTSAKGMDCSGFTKTVYFLNGIVLARDASQQVHTGILVDTQNGFENLHAGDLLFFGAQATDSTKERITHVAIYIGNNEFIHAAGRIKINSFDKNAPNFSEFRLLHFIRAKRILGSVDENGVTSVKRNKFYLGEF